MHFVHGTYSHECACNHASVRNLHTSRKKHYISVRCENHHVHTSPVILEYKKTKDLERGRIKVDHLCKLKL